jgi:hypothetical protein
MKLAFLPYLLATLLSATAAQAAAASERETLDITLSSVAHAVGVFAPAQREVTESVVVDAARSAGFVLVSPAALEVEVIDPRGQVWTGLPGDERASSFRLDDVSGLPWPGLGRGQHTVVLVPEPLPGRYEVRLLASAPMTEATPYALAVLPESELRLGLALPEPTVTTGAAIAIAGLLFDGEEPVRGGSVTAFITSEPDPDAKETPSPLKIELLDDGEGADTAAGDGIYTGILVADTPGTFLVLVRAEGASPSGLAFQRDTGGVVRVTEPTSRLDGLP